MRVKVEYISHISIENVSVPFYITEDSGVYVGCQIMPFLKSLQQVKQCLITDIDDVQYEVYPLTEVCKFIKKKELIINLNTANIEPKKHLPKAPNSPETSEFILALRRIAKPQNKKK